MGATVSPDKSNDTKAITAAMKGVGKDIGDIEKSLAAIKKLVAEVTKNPDECRKPVDSMCDSMGYLLSTATEWKSLGKSLSKAIQK